MTEFDPSRLCRNLLVILRIDVRGGGGWLFIALLGVRDKEAEGPSGMGEVQLVLESF